MTDLYSLAATVEAQC